MAKFDARTAVEALEFDFEAYGGSKGPINEPSTGRVNEFFANMKSLMKEASALQATAKDLQVEETDDLDDEQLAAKMEGIGEAEGQAIGFQSKSIEYLALLCGAQYEDIRDGDGNIIETRIVGGAPSVEDLNCLPFRVLQAFTQWLMGEIRPKKAVPAGRR